MDIQDIIPLREITEPKHVVPKLKHFFKPTKTQFKFALKKALLEELGLEAPETDAMVAEDPFLLLGYGINAFFDLLAALS